ncbi:MAG: CAP domain-containing protein [Pseudomonadota bacterium]
MFRQLSLVFALLAAPAAACELDPAQAQAVINETNSYRAAQGRASLEANTRLTRAAEGHACALAASGRFSHESKNGDGVGDRARDEGYRWRFVAENIARGQRDASAVMDSWQTSSGHNRNLLARGAREIGVASVVTSRGPLWVMVLGAPL